MGSEADNILKPYIGIRQELVPNELYWIIFENYEQATSEILRRKDSYLFSSNVHEMYTPVMYDFGPVEFAVVAKFRKFVLEKSKHPNLRGRKMMYYVLPDPNAIINSLFLLSTYMVLELKMTQDAVGKVISRIPVRFPHFRDAVSTVPMFCVKICDCLDAVCRAVALKWFDAETFYTADTEFLRTEYDISLLCDRFVALSDPGHDGKQPALFVPIFHELGVQVVIRLNDDTSYDRSVFEAEGIRVYDIFFEDCKSPTPDCVRKFLTAIDHARGLVAIHCKAGLGRTGTMIALWLIHRHSFPARSAIAYTRLCRPGCVMGIQQLWLVFMEQQIARAKIDSTARACNDLAGFVEIDGTVLNAVAVAKLEEKPKTQKRQEPSGSKVLGRRWSLPQFLRKSSLSK